MKNEEKLKYDRDEAHQELYRMLAEISDPEDIKILLEDLCTYNEVEQMAQRLFCVKLFLGGLTYSQIIEKINISSATLSRVSRCFKRGSGGYSKVVKNYFDGKKDKNDD